MTYNVLLCTRLLLTYLTRCTLSCATLASALVVMETPGLVLGLNPSHNKEQLVLGLGEHLVITSTVVGELCRGYLMIEAQRSYICLSVYVQSAVVTRLVLGKYRATRSAAVVPTLMVSYVNVRNALRVASVTLVKLATGIYAFTILTDVKV